MELLTVGAAGIEFTVTLVDEVTEQPALLIVTVKLPEEDKGLVAVFCAFGLTTFIAGAQENVRPEGGVKEYNVPFNGKAPGTCPSFAVTLLEVFVEKVMLLKLVEVAPVNPEDTVPVAVPIAP